MSQIHYVSRFCDHCLKLVQLTADGYCPICGKHADNMVPQEFSEKDWDDKQRWDDDEMTNNDWDDEEDLLDEIV